MSRDFTPGDMQDPREEGSAPRPPIPRPDTRQPERPSPGRDSGIDTRPAAPRDTRPSDSRTEDLRTVFYDRDRAYRLQNSEVHTLAELGRFRAIAAENLAKYAYEGHRDRMQQDLHNLVRQGLIQKRTFEGPDASPRELLTLTKAGQDLLRANRLVRGDQSIYQGFVKPKEVNHDADIYRLYQRETERIEAK